MSNEIKVQIREIGELQIVGKNNTNKREFVGVEVSERESKYENILKFTLIAKNVAKIDKCAVGDIVNVHYDVRGRQWKEHIFIDLQAWKIDEIATASDTDEVNEQPMEIPPATTDDVFDGLPF